MRNDMSPRVVSRETGRFTVIRNVRHNVRHAGKPGSTSINPRIADSFATFRYTRPGNKGGCAAVVLLDVSRIAVERRIHGE